MTQPIANQSEVAALQQQLAAMQQQIGSLQARSVTQLQSLSEMKVPKPIESPPPLYVPSIKEATLGGTCGVGVGVFFQLSFPLIALCGLLGVTVSPRFSQARDYLVERISVHRLRGLSLLPIKGGDKSYFAQDILKKKQPEIFEEALKILNIPEEHAQDAVFIEKNYREIVSALEGRVSKVPSYFAQPIKELIQVCHIAYQTLKGGKDHGKSS